MKRTSSPGAMSPGSPSENELRDQLASLVEQQQRLFTRLETGERHFQQLARSVWRVQEEERRRLARELHDGIGQHLTALKHKLDRLLATAGRGPTDQTLMQALELCDIAIQETRTLSRLLRPQILDDLGLDAALRWLARHTSDGSGTSVEIDVKDLPPDLDGDVSTLIFRVAQEALTNVMKHAGAHTIVLRLMRRDDQLQLLIVDDGRGCDVNSAFDRASEGQSTGLNSIRERVRLFGGQFVATSAAGEGFQLRVSLPLPPHG